MATLPFVFPDHNDLLATSPEDLAGILLEIGPGLQNQYYSIDGLVFEAFPVHGGLYPLNVRRAVTMAIAEAFAWLVSQGLLVPEPEQLGPWFSRTRRAMALQTRSDVEVYRRAKALPIELLQPYLAEKVRPLFLRGDYDTAVFQAFKEVEVCVRRAANGRGAGFPNDLVGVGLMRKAFHPDNGPLTDPKLVGGEREAEMALFAGAIGHAKNPTSHQEPGIEPARAAKLIVFASHLLSIVESRSA